MEGFERHFNKPLKFTHHALLRGRQMGLNEENLRDIICFARKVDQKGSERIYQSGSTKFFTAYYPDKIVVKTVWDDYLMRNPYQK